MSWQSTEEYCKYKIGDSDYPYWRNPNEIPKCSRCQTDLINFKNYGSSLKTFECSSPHCFWNEWYERQRPKGFQECYDKFRKMKLLEK